MAILSKIREKTFVLILVIGLALFAFVIGDAINKDGGNARVDIIGEVNGEEISRDEFNQQLESYRNRAQGRVSDFQTINAVWDVFVRERIFKAQLEEAGIVVGENDVWQALTASPNFQNNPQFQNEIGLFSEEKVKEYIADMREDAIGSAKNSQENLRWQSWLDYEYRVRQGVVQSAYTSLVNVGLGASLEEGKREYLYNNTNLTAQYVYVPYSSIADSLITITNADYQEYIKENEKEFQVDEARSIKFVKFNITASQEDKDAIKADLSTLKDGFSSAEDNFDFVEEEGTDLAVNKNFIYKNRLFSGIADEVIDGEVGNVVGPYEEAGYYKLSKVEAFKQMPDSVSASHILVSYVGLRSAGPDTKQSRDEAKATADSLLTVIKRSPSKFNALAEEFSVDKSSAVNGGELDWYAYNTMTPAFRDYTFLNKKGDMGVVETPFGFHVIKITGQKNIQKTAQLTTIARKIDASEITESKYFQDAEIFASKLADGASFDALAQENTYVSLPANGLKALDENVPGITGTNRQIVRWAFGEDTSVNDVKRFDVDNGFAVVVLSSKTKKGTATVNDVASKIKPILINEKKAALINQKMTAATLEELASANNVSVRTVSNVTLASPTISGVGSEPAIVGAMSVANEGEVLNNLEGEKGVFAIKVTTKVAPTELEDYNTYRNRIATKYQSRSTQLFNALKEVSEIEDYRANIY